MKLLWRGTGLGYGRLGFLRWRVQRWTFSGRRYAFGPLVLVRKERVP